jgi:hypothetical protein
LNYLSHTYLFLDDPYFVAGACTPDWVRVLGKSFRAPRKRAEELLKTTYEVDDVTARYWRGIVQHHVDDEWFHCNESFVMLSAKLAVELGRIHGREQSARSMFLGHIVIELLLDSKLTELQPWLLDKFYASLLSLDREQLQSFAERVVGKALPDMAHFIGRFHDEKFLADYSNDVRLLHRLNQVMKRVGLPPLGDETLAWIARSRQLVDESFDELLPRRPISPKPAC